MKARERGWDRLPSSSAHQQQWWQGQWGNSDECKASYQAAQWGSASKWDTFAGNQETWEGIRGNWDQPSYDGVSGHEEFENILNWDDSAAQEAFHIATERYEATLRGQVYPISLPSPDLYTQVVDWETYENFDLPESADTFSAGEETKGQRKRGRKVVGRYHNARRDSNQHKHVEGYKVAPTNNKRSIAWDDEVHKNHGNMSRDCSLPAVSSHLLKASAYATSEKLQSGLPRGQNLQVHSQTQDSGWRHHFSNSSQHKSSRRWREPNTSFADDQAVAGWGQRNPLNPTPHGTMRDGISAAHPEVLPTSSGSYYNVQMGQNHLSGKGPVVHNQSSRLEDWQCASNTYSHGNSPQDIVSFPDKTRRWGQHYKPHWHRDR